MFLHSIKVYRYVHWGTVIDGRFIPGAKYVRASPEERARLIFQEEWDLGAIESMSRRRGPGRPASGGENRSRLYGDVWLLEKIAEKLGIRKGVRPEIYLREGRQTQAGKAEKSSQRRFIVETLGKL